MPADAAFEEASDIATSPETRKPMFEADRVCCGPIASCGTGSAAGLEEQGLSSSRGTHAGGVDGRDELADDMLETLGGDKDELLPSGIKRYAKPCGGTGTSANWATFAPAPLLEAEHVGTVNTGALVLRELSSCICDCEGSTETRGEKAERATEDKLECCSARECAWKTG